EFSGRDDVLLRLAVGSTDRAPGGNPDSIEATVRRFMAELAENGNPPPAVEVIPMPSSESERARLHRDADCFLSPHRAEGTCRHMLEAMSMALPVIASNWGATAEVFDEATGYPLQCDVAKVRSTDPDCR